MQQDGSKYFACRPPTPLTWSIGQNSIFPEHGHVAYQIKGNHSMQYHGSKYFAREPLPTLSPHPLTLWLRPKGQNSTFHNMVMLHIKTVLAISHIP